MRANSENLRYAREFAGDDHTDEEWRRTILSVTDRMSRDYLLTHSPFENLPSVQLAEAEARRAENPERFHAVQSYAKARCAGASREEAASTAWGGGLWSYVRVRRRFYTSPLGQLVGVTRGFGGRLADGVFTRASRLRADALATEVLNAMDRYVTYYYYPAGPGKHGENL